jgi:hypothetical protein
MTLRIAYVTSGMGSVGTAICQSLARSGHTVVAGCAPNSPRKANWLREQREQGFDFIASEGNATDWASTSAAFAKVRAEVGEVDVLVNNSGGSRDLLFRQMTVEDWNAVIASNLNALFNLPSRWCNLAARGRIINIGCHALTLSPQLSPLARPARVRKPNGPGRHRHHRSGAIRGRWEDQGPSGRSTPPPGESSGLPAERRLHLAKADGSSLPRLQCPFRAVRA